MAIRVNDEWPMPKQLANFAVRGNAKYTNVDIWTSLSVRYDENSWD